MAMDKELEEPDQLNEDSLELLNELIGKMKPGELIHISRGLDGLWTIMTTIGGLAVGVGETPQTAFDNEVEVEKEK
jgi:hypothetical protein